MNLDLIYKSDKQQELEENEKISKLRYDMSFTNDYILNKHNFDELCDKYRRMRKEIKYLKAILEDIKSYDLYTYDLDYDYEENPIDNYCPFEIEYIIENTIKLLELEENEEKEDINL